MGSYLYDELTEKLWKAFRKTRKQLLARPGYAEHEQRNALVHALEELDVPVSVEVPVIHKHNGQRIGVGFMDLVLDCRVVVEVKQVEVIRASDIAQLDRYIEDSGLAVGVIVNFGCKGADLDSDFGRKKVYLRRYKPEHDPYKRG